MTASPKEPPPIESFDVRVLRQDGPGQKPYWERHRIKYQGDMNVISALQSLAAQSTTAEGKRVSPVAWDCNCLEEVCGACTMVINGRVRQACSALIDTLLQERPGEIELRPAAKFPVIRDLVVDRGRLFHALKRVHAWIHVDGYHDLGPGPLQARTDQEQLYPLSQCMSCGCCLEACPQYQLVEVPREAGESDEDYQKRQEAAYNRSFLGAHAISQAMLFNSHPTGRYDTKERLEALMQEGGIQVCGNAQNCVAVCPKHIPLTTSIARAGRATTIQALRRFFDQ